MELTDGDLLSQVINEPHVDEEKNNDDTQKFSNDHQEIRSLYKSEYTEIGRFQYPYWFIMKIVFTFLVSINLYLFLLKDVFLDEVSAAFVGKIEIFASEDPNYDTKYFNAY